MFFFCFFFKQKTAYEMRISDWSSDVCSSDLIKILLLFPMVHMPRGWEAARLRSDHETKEKGASFRPQSQLVAVGRRKIRRHPPLENAALHPSSEERRVGNECVSKCRSRWSQYH